MEQGCFLGDCGVNFLAIGFSYTSQSTLSVLISNCCRENFTSLKNHRKTQPLVHNCYRQLNTEHLLSDMMKYYRLSVSRRDVKRMGKYSPSISVFPPECMLFRFRTVPMSVPELCHVPNPSCAMFRYRASSRKFFITKLIRLTPDSLWTSFLFCFVVVLLVLFLFFKILFCRRRVVFGD